MIKKILSILTVSIFLIFSKTVSAVESQDPIKLTLHDWTG